MHLSILVLNLEDLGSMYSKDKLFLIATFYSSHRHVYLPTVKFIYSEKVKIFCEISTVVGLSYVCSNGQIYGGDFAKFFGLLRIYEL